MSETENTKKDHFIWARIREDVAQGKNEGKVVTRFPPEPNGFLHIGHAKSICLNFGTAIEFGGACNLRFDDTNPEKEEQAYIDAIREDVHWLGFEWAGEPRHASDYFDYLYESAVKLIKDGKAYVCGLNAEQAREYRGTLTEPGKNSPHRDQSVEENLDLFERMRKGEFEEGQYVLRAKIDMASPNINMRDPIIYRIRFAEHHQTGDKWCIYPMYDFTHCLSDAVEGITHSLCTLEFEDHRPLYDWVINEVDTPVKPQQIEFARLNLNYTVTSKRKLKQLVDEGHVEGWNDPRMPTISGLRRRGYTPASIRNFCERIGVTRSDSVVDVGMLEHAIREDLEHSAPRAMCVLRPLKVVITNYEEGKEESIQAPVHQKYEEMGKRTLMFGREIYIDQSDFEIVPPPKYKRLTVDKEIRLRNSYVIKCNEYITDDDGNVVELRCTYDPDTLGKNPEGRKVKGVIHWVSAEHGVPCHVNVYDRLFKDENPDSDKEVHFLEHLNPESLEVLDGAIAEPSLANAKPEDRFQFEREGYFAVDLEKTDDGRLVFNRTVTLRDSWAKINK